MKRGRFFRPVRALCVALCGAITVPALAEPRTGGAEVEQALDLFQQGNRFYEEGDAPRALERYLEAWRVSATYEIAANLGIVELVLGKPRAAAEHLAFAVAHYPPSAQAAKLAQIRETLSLAKREVVSVSIRLPDPSVEVLIDQVSALGEGTLREVFVDPGAHVIAARGDGLQANEKHIVAAPGVAIEITFAGGRAALDNSPVVQTPRPVPRSRSKREEPKTAVIVSGAALATAAAGVGVGYLAASLSSLADARDASDSLKGDARADRSYCLHSPSRFAELCSGLTTATQNQARFQNIAVASFVGAAIAAVATGAYGLWPRRAQTIALEVVPLVEGGRLGASLRKGF